MHQHAYTKPSFMQQFMPKLFTVLREGYNRHDMKADFIAGLTVAIVALPLSMAIAIASGTTPDRGLFTAIIAGFLISLLGGSRFQVGGPAGAFIVLVAATLERHGMNGLLLAVMMAGALLMIMGFLRLGTYIKFIPYPVTVGFTAGIAVIILASQLKDFLGLAVTTPEPSAIIPKLQFLTQSIGSFRLEALYLSGLTVLLIVGIHRYKPHWPNMLIAVVLTSILAVIFHLPIETIGTRFGGIPHTLLPPSLPTFSWQQIGNVLPDAVAFALLGAIESLLSAVVADGMTGRRHRSNCELVAQGFANIVSAFFGGICATGAIARTATNIRAGARSPIAGMLHSVFLLLFMIVAAPLASYIPLSTLAGVLVIVAWNMIERDAIKTLLHSSWGDAFVLVATCSITIFRDLTEGILVGFCLGSLLFLDRMSREIIVKRDVPPLVPDDIRDDSRKTLIRDQEGVSFDDEALVIYRISGAFFFGAVPTVGSILDQVLEQPKYFILDFSDVPFLDATAARMIESFVTKAQQRDVELFFTGVSESLKLILSKYGLTVNHICFQDSIADAVSLTKKGSTSHVFERKSHDSSSKKS